MRIGGAYAFESNDIAQQIRTKFPGISRLDLTKSVLLTHLVRVIDIATRKIMLGIDPNLPYFSEANSFVFPMCLIKPEDFLVLEKEVMPGL